MHFLLFLISCTLLNICTLSAQNLIKKYIGIQTTYPDSSSKILLETFLTDKSKQSSFKKKHLDQRTEYNEEGRIQLSLFYSHTGAVSSKGVYYYPTSNTEKRIFKQANNSVDSVFIRYHPKTKLRLSEYYFWGQTQNTDRVFFNYNSKNQLVSIHRINEWSHQWDTISYNQSTISSLARYQNRTQLKETRNFSYSPKQQLIKTELLNRKQQIIEETFFYYRKELLKKTITKRYNQTQKKEQLTVQYSYYKNKQLKQQKEYHQKGKKRHWSMTLKRYSEVGFLEKEVRKNKLKGIYSIRIIKVTHRKKN